MTIDSPIAEGNTIRLSQVARKLNVGTNTIVAHLIEKGIEVENKPHAKITLDQLNMLAKEFAGASMDKEEASEIAIGEKYADNPPLTSDEAKHGAQEKEAIPRHETILPQLPGVTLVGKTELEQTSKPAPKKSTPSAQASEAATDATPTPTAVEEEQAAPVEKITIDQQESLKGLTVLGKMVVPKSEEKKFRQVASSDTKQAQKKRPRKRITTPSPVGSTVERKARQEKGGISEQEIQEKIKNTLAKLDSGKTQAANRAKYRKEKRSAITELQEEALLRGKEEVKTLKVTEFISANDLASLLGVSVNEVISTCMSLGMVTSINQRLDVDAITIIAHEFGYQVEFTDVQEEIVEEQEHLEDLVARPPIVTVMGHVDHGKTSLLDHIRKTEVTKGEAGGITQHIGAYDIVTESGARIAFLDTPGHEAFTAMRARGAKITDIVIIVVAADDKVMPQTKEAINHAQIAGVPIVIAINKIDKPGANPDKIKEELSSINILVEDWGGKYQSQTISAKTGQGINELLEKVLLEAELLALQANPNKKARGTVLEASLDQGKGYVATLLVQSGTLKAGDVVLADAYYGKVKAMTNHQGDRVQEAILSTPVQVLGLNGAPQAGSTFRVMSSDKEAREVAIHKQQILREQSLRTKTHITLDEIGRRLAIGNFKELNIILKGDVDGSVQALADALLQLSTEEVQVNIIHKSVGAITKSDVLLASATDAIVLGFQVRPSAHTRKLAEKEGIEIRLYSIIYDAISHVKDAMQGMLAPSIEEVITGNATVREVFKIAKVGTVAGCYVTDGYIKKAHSIRLTRDGIVIYTGNISQLKRFKEDVQEVKNGFECGMNIANFNDIKVDDEIEGFVQKEVARKL